MSDEEKHPILKAIEDKFVTEYGFKSYDCNENGDDYDTNGVVLEALISPRNKYSFVMEGNELIIYGPYLQRIGEYEIGDPNSFDMDKIEKLVLTELVEKYKFDKKKIELRRQYYNRCIDCLNRTLEKVRT